MNIDEIAALIDHTLLKPEATGAEVKRLCQEAREHRFASVCVNPCYVGLAVDCLSGSAVKTCTVSGFPLGATFPEVKAAEAERALTLGAEEIDMVINIGALKAGEHAIVRHDILAVAEVCRPAGALLKVIIEAAYLTEEEKETACRIVVESAADFVKTSTGFAPSGARKEDVQLMRRVVGERMGVKAAGGIRDYATLREMVQAGANRIGTSSGVKICLEAKAWTEKGPER